jgi:guanylate kinase
VSRLVGRGTESKQEQQRRLETAKIELEAESEFDVTVVNDSVERAAQEIAHIVGAESAEA